MTEKKKEDFSKKEKSIKKIERDCQKNRHKVKEISHNLNATDLDELDSMYEDFDSFEKM